MSGEYNKYVAYQVTDDVLLCKLSDGKNQIWVTYNSLSDDLKTMIAEKHPMVTAKFYELKGKAAEKERLIQLEKTYKKSGEMRRTIDVLPKNKDGKSICKTSKEWKALEPWKKKMIERFIILSQKKERIKQQKKDNKKRKREFEVKSILGTKQRTVLVNGRREKQVFIQVEWDGIDPKTQQPYPPGEVQYKDLNPKLQEVYKEKYRIGDGKVKKYWRKRKAKLEEKRKENEVNVAEEKKSEVTEEEKSKAVEEEKSKAVEKEKSKATEKDSGTVKLTPNPHRPIQHYHESNMVTVPQRPKRNFNDLLVEMQRQGYVRIQKKMRIDLTKNTSYDAMRRRIDFAQQKEDEFKNAFKVIRSVFECPEVNPNEFQNSILNRSGVNL